METVKFRINMTTKDSLRKQVLVSMSLDNTNNIMILSNKHIVNINRALKEIKSEVIAELEQIIKVFILLLIKLHPI